MVTMSKLATSDFVGVRLGWAALLLVTLAVTFWRELRSLTWSGRGVLVIAFVAFGVIDGVLVPRLRDRAVATMVVTIVELGCIILLGWSLHAMSL